MWIDETFPKLAESGYRITSDPAEQYNCIAWAVGVDNEWWSHLPGYRWPTRRGSEVGSLVELFVNMGFEVCENQKYEDGYEKIAVFGKEGRWTHAARQLDNGHWTSKLGMNEDIEHVALEGLIGVLYGDIYCALRRLKFKQ